MRHLPRGARAVRAAARANLDNADAYSAHSLRAGAATAAAKNGAPRSAIAAQGRWSFPRVNGCRCATVGSLFGR
jgi:hypothetical protein